MVLSEEHFIFRRKWSAYNLEAYNNRELLPIGLAAMGASVRTLLHFHPPITT